MKRGALALSVVLLTAACSTYDAATAPGVIGAHPVDANRLPAGGADLREAPRDEPTVSDAAARLPAAAVLHAWDRRRARAWATGDAQGLADLYTVGSSAGRADVALLRSYVRRGLRVVGLRMQVFELRVLVHRPRGWRLRVTDRLARAVAVGPAERMRLPRDLASTRVITLLRGRDGEWRVSRVEPVPGR